MKEIELKQREIFTPRSLSIREGEEKREGVIEGVAIVVNAETVLYECSEFREVEVIDPSCIAEEFIREQDIKLNLLHDRNSSIARTPTSLRMQVMEDGLHFEADIPDCDLGKRARALIGNGTYTGCSFEFYPKDYAVKERTGADGKTEYVIRHTAFEKITALTIAMDPAYEATSVNARELYLRSLEEAGGIQQAGTPAHPDNQSRPVGTHPDNQQAGTPAHPDSAAREEMRKRDRKIASVRMETEMLNCN